nr:immunoglobulin light chain junction region [Macaca mulatta]MOW14525.1 immunoglobulin light chain junction region [Macaca mulatta]
CHQYHDLFRTF